MPLALLKTQLHDPAVILFLVRVDPQQGAQRLFRPVDILVFDIAVVELLQILLGQLLIAGALKQQPVVELVAVPDIKVL